MEYKKFKNKLKIAAAAQNLINSNNNNMEGTRPLRGLPYPTF
jgi:hypothetical protein